MKAYCSQENFLALESFHFFDINIIFNMLISIVYNIKVPKKSLKIVFFFYFPSIKKINLLISKAQFLGRKPGNGNLCAETLPGEYSWDHPLQGRMNKERKSTSLIWQEEKYSEAVSTRIQKILKGFRSWVSLAELWCTGAR